MNASIPDRLRLHKDGSITLDDGGDVKAYMKIYAKSQNVKRGAPLSISIQSRRQALFIASMARLSLAG